MDRMALSNRLNGLSEVFASGTAMGEDLKAMAYVLANKIDDEKFSKILNASFAEEAVGPLIPPPPGYGAQHGGNLPSLSGKEYPNTPMKSDVDFVKAMHEAYPDQPPTMYAKALSAIKNLFSNAPGAPALAPALVMASEEQIEKDANMNEGLYWNKEATNVVVANLLRDVLGMDKSIEFDTHRHLTKEQTPDGGHAGEKASTLKPDQIPDQEYLDSGIVEKSHGKVKKEANDEDGEKVPEEAPVEEKKPVEDDTKEKTEEKKEETPVEAAAEKTEEAPVEAAVETPSTFSFEGIEMEASMDEVVMSESEKVKLSALFN